MKGNAVFYNTYNASFEMLTTKAEMGKSLAKKIFLFPKIVKAIQKKVISNNKSENKEVASYTIAETARQYRSHILRNLG